MFNIEGYIKDRRSILTALQASGALPFFIAKKGSKNARRANVAFAFLEEFGKGLSMASRIRIQPKLLLFYSAGMVEMIKLLLSRLYWNFVFVFT
ncbi:MAG: hypothetical protein DWQ02_01395 [Bacteroidetes bacterium]|nr:MAG: hypothetical protein DWQ02_01395 [Bacteroidota bacterium]